MPDLLKITYFVHGTTTDNEQHLSSGWKDVELSELGIKQSIELKELTKDKKFDVIFCSDLKRAVRSASLTWGNSIKTIQDKRLRECNYGDLNGASSKQVDAIRSQCVDKPFHNGESYKDVEKRIHSFLEEISKKYAGKHIAIVAHQGPQLALDVIVNKKSWPQALKEDWRHQGHAGWKPGWEHMYAF